MAGPAPRVDRPIEPREVVVEVVTARDAAYAAAEADKAARRASDAADIKWAQLIRPTATTHSCETEQRPGLVLPGWYMLFPTDRAGVPSVAHRAPSRSERRR